MENKINYNILIKENKYTLVIKNDMYTKLFYGVKKIDLEIVNKAFIDSNDNLFKDGVNIIAIKSSEYQESYNSIMFIFYENSKTIYLTGIANNRFIKSNKFSSTQIIDTFTIYSYRKDNRNSIIKINPPLKTISSSNKLKIVKKGLK